ncbi:DUF4129 domain-containing protein [Lederbergia sp. NSJ-179]|uniref:DUF4129 domain-containing protein n=1 Tax=Lederbergia sp. NSJ-179 TaxID=2931402 RepID=UPI001FD349C9|nr:DUF4129 domain-containing protein [Lederbergia sp. NSJ-179]MCJ7842246.1 DUF4129 domain-containing protein [Lederbergia sp. NSJ-179]
MKQLKTSFYHGFTELLLTFPLVLMAGVLLIGSEKLWVWLFSLWGLFLIGILLRALWPQQEWWFYTFLALCLGLLPTWIFSDIWYMQIPLAIIQVVFAFRGLTYQGDSSAIPLLFMWYSGLLIYFGGYFLFRYQSLFQPYLTVFSICGIVLVGIILLLSNDEALNTSTLSKKQKPYISRTIQRQNRFFLLGTFLVILVISNFGKIREWLWNGFKAVLRFLFGQTSETNPEPIIEEGAPSSPMLPDLPAGEKSAFAEFLDMVMTYIAYVVVGVIVLFLLLLLIKEVRRRLVSVLRRFFRFIKDLLNRSPGQRETEQYIDEKESLFDWEEWKKEQQTKAKNIMKQLFNREPRYETLMNREKVRFIYRKFIERQTKGVEFRFSMTPREVLRHVESKQDLNLLREAYEQARYGELDVDEQTLQKLYEEVQKVR